MNKIINVPSSTVGEATDIASPSFTLGVEGTTRKNESILLMLFSLLLTGTESERDICRFWDPFFCKGKISVIFCPTI